MVMAKILSTLVESQRARATDAKHNREAVDGYRCFVAQHPKRALDRQTLTHIDAYARTVLGSPRFASWLQLYSAVYGRFVEGWIPDNYFARVVLPRVQNPTRKGVSNVKTLTRRILRTDLLPDLVYHVRGCWLDGNNQSLAPTAVVDAMFAAGDEVIVKRDMVSRGRGIFRLHRRDFVLADLQKLGNFVVQERIIQAPVFDRIIAGPVTTLRITTTKAVGAPARAHRSILRFGRRDEIGLDAKTEVIVPVIDDRGTIADDGYLGDWSMCRTHPDTGAAFAGLVVPAYREAVATCLALHDTIPHLAIAGWDVALDHAERVRLLELNTGHVGINVMQATGGPCFQDMNWESLWRTAPAPNPGETAPNTERSLA